MQDAGYGLLRIYLTLDPQKNTLTVTILEQSGTLLSSVFAQISCALSSVQNRQRFVLRDLPLQ